jgi:xanthine dehydrogenase YagS FAD-binding subunit
MRAFEYASPTTKEQAVALLGSRWGEREVLAGGTDLLSLMKDAVVEPKRVVNIKEIAELQGIKYSEADGLRLGALATFQELLDSDVVAKQFPALAQAAEGVRSEQIRAVGTVAGDLCQRPRCWYFRGGMGLLAQDSSGKSLVVDGENRYHAILGNAGPAYYVSPSSLAPALIALGAKVRLFGPKGAREVTAEKFFVTAKAGTDRENVLAPNEIVTEIVVPAGATANATYEVRHGESLDWPLAAAAVSLKMSGKTVTAARVVLGHVAPVPWPSAEAEKVLTGKAVSAKLAEQAGAAAVKDAKPLSQNAYKVQLTRVAVKRAILRAVEGRA